MNTIPNFRGFWSIGGGNTPSTTGNFLVGWGKNRSSILNFPKNTREIIQSISSPVQISSVSNWNKVQFVDGNGNGSFSPFTANIFALLKNGSLIGLGSRNPLMLSSTSPDIAYNPVNLGINHTWKDFSASSSMHMLAIRSDNTLWAWGNNNTYQLGLGGFTSGNNSSPVQVGLNQDWIQVCASGYDPTMASSFGIRGANGATSVTHGTLWAWGRNRNGQLGVGTTADRFAPTQIGGETGWASVFSSYTDDFFGAVVTFGIKKDRTLWAWGGDRSYYALGLGNVRRSSSPVQVGTNADWYKAQCVNGYSVGLRDRGESGETGKLFAWGRNPKWFWYPSIGPGGVLGKITVPTQVFDGCKDFAIFPSRADYDGFFTGVRTDSVTVVVQKHDNTIWVKGNFNPYGILAKKGAYQTSFEQIGSSSNWTKVVAAQESSFGLQTDGSLWAWGSNLNGVLGIGNTVAMASFPIQVGTTAAWSDISSSGEHVIAMRSNGTLWSWGNNASGRLGLMTSPFATDRSFPVQIGANTDWASVATIIDDSSNSAAIKTNGTLWTWGENYSGQLGIGNIIDRSSPSQVGSGTTGPWVKVSCGRHGMLGIQQDGSLWAWGSNNYGRLGLGNSLSTSIPVRVGSLTGWKDAQLGSQHANAIRDDGTLWGWGSFRSGIPIAASVPMQIGVDTDWKELNCTKYGTVALKTNDTLWGWGKVVPSMFDSGGYLSNISPIQIGVDAFWKKFDAAGDSWFLNKDSPELGHILAIKSDGTLWGRGITKRGQLGPNFRSLSLWESSLLADGWFQIPGLTADSLATATSFSTAFGVIVKR